MNTFAEYIHSDFFALSWVRALLTLVIGWPVLRVAAGLLRKTLKKHASAQLAMLGYQTVYYGGVILLMLSVLTELGMNITTLLGAAGIAGVAIGFAAQTSLSNLISGIFLIWEKPFQVEDIIKVGSSMGVVMEIDLLSTKVRTFDNTLVRIPNEMMIKSELTNVTRFEIRRLDVNVGVAYKEDVAKVIQVLREIANENPWCLDEPEPLILFKGFGNSSLDFLFGVWFSKTDFLALRNSIQQEVHERFRSEGIEIPFPHLSLYTGSVSEPFPIRMIQEEDA